MNVRTWLALLLVCGLVLRIAIWVTYEPVVAPDTASYFAAAQDLVRGDLERSQGRRTPGYPALVAAAGFDPGTIVLLQMLGGLATAALLFYIALWFTGRAGFAFAVGMTYNLNLQQLSFEPVLLTESFSTLTVVALVATAVAALRRLRRDEASAALLLLFGALAGVAILVRPQYVFLLLLVPAIVLLATPGSLWAPRRVGAAALSAAPIALMVFAWMGWVYAKSGAFALSTQTGFGLANHSVAFVEAAPDRYATLRSILLKAREVKLAEQGHHGNAGWLALPEMMRATGMTLPEVSRELQRMSVELFVAHPYLYARSVAQSWIDFWSVPSLLQPDRVSQPAIAAMLASTWWIEHKALRLANLAFVLIVASVLLSPRLRAVTQWDLSLTFISAVVLLSSLVQALADYGASGRYAVTVQALVVLLVMTVCLRIYRGRTTATHQAGRLSGVA